MKNTKASQSSHGVFLDLGSVNRDDLDLKTLQDTLAHWDFYPTTEPCDIAARIRPALVVVSNKVPLTRETLVTAPNLRLICVAATGVNNVDLAAARDQGIAVCNVRGYATASVVQHVFALILALTTRLVDYRRAVCAGAWERSEQFCLLDFPIHELTGKSLGIIGHGELGRAVARAAPVFGMEVMIAERQGRPTRTGRVVFEDVLIGADIISLHCPLTPVTRGLIGPEALACMKPNALLINTARGGIIDEAALAEALRRGKVGGAGVDVLHNEPPNDGNPLLAPDIPNLILTPHIAWASREARQRLVDELADNVSAFLADRPRNVVA